MLNSKRRRQPKLLALFAALLFCRALPVLATTINVTDADPHYSAVESPCGTHTSCGVVAHLNTTPISYGSNVVFNDSFDAWNGLQGAEDKWTKVDGVPAGGDFNATLNVSTFDAQSFHGAGHVGGVEIQVDLVYAGADRAQFFWSQGLYTNYTTGPGGGITTPYSEMDTGSSPSDPKYPFQYPEKFFYDFPKAPYESGFFEADAMLTKLNYDTRTMTVYGGVHYGFYLYAIPEPASAVLLLLGVAIAIRLRGKRYTSLSN
jgi:hypothetical protein